ncbi:MAG: hypothetical protein CBD74_00225, partial [Saprospirales bacterium TMED214]
MKFQSFKNVNFGTLNASKNDHAIVYDAETNKYILRSADGVFENGVESPEVFSEIVGSDIDRDNLSVK